MQASELVAAALIIALTSLGSAQAQETSDPADQIRATADRFVTAFNAGDSKALSLLWAPDGDYVDETGHRLVGREAIEQAYSEFFTTHPGVKILVSIDSIRLLNDSTAIEDGHARLAPAPTGPPAASRYTAVHVKQQNGEWLMASVRDARVEVPSNYLQLADLEFLVGDWEAEQQGIEWKSMCRWLEGKNFLERTSTAKQDGQTISLTREIIGWDPQSGGVRSWTFSSDGGIAIGAWTPHEAGWLIESTGVLADGTPTAAVYVLSQVDPDTLAWKSLRRRRAGVSLPETSERLLHRSPQQE